MHLSTIILLAGAFTTSTLARVTDDYANLPSPEGTMIFCSEKNYSGNCEAPAYFTWDQCVTIPDSNAVGDKGSSWYVTGGNSNCKLFTAPNCTGEASAWNRFMNELKRDPPYRYFKCRQNAHGY